VLQCKLALHAVEDEHGTLHERVLSLPQLFVGLVDELEDQLSCLVVGASRLIYARVAFLRPLVLSEGGINCVDEVLVALGVICVVKLLED